MSVRRSSQTRGVSPGGQPSCRYGSASLALVPISAISQTRPACCRQSGGTLPSPRHQTGGGVAPCHGGAAMTPPRRHAGATAAPAVLALRQEVVADLAVPRNGQVDMRSKAKIWRRPWSGRIARKGIGDRERRQWGGRPACAAKLAGGNEIDVAVWLAPKQGGTGNPKK